jgi:hypothetical protein
MSHFQDPNHPDVTQPLSQRYYYVLINTLTRGLPPPLSDTPQALLDRNQAAVDKVAAMLPVNAHEADLAARCVAAGAQADDVMQSIREHAGDDIKTVMKLNAQYVALLRASLSAHGHLLRAQAVRHKRESSTPAADADAWTLHIATDRMRQGLAEGAVPAEPPAMLMPDPLECQTQVPAPPPQVMAAEPIPAPAAQPPQPPVPATPPLAPVPAEQSPRCGGARPLADADEPPSDLAAEAERYAIVYPRRAQLIRQHGGLPPNCDFGPPDDDLVDAIVTGTSPALRALDDPVHA